MIGRNTEESTSTQPPNPNSQSDDVALRCTTTRLQPSAIKYGGNTNGPVSNHMNPELRGRSDFANKIPVGTPINPQTVVVPKGVVHAYQNIGEKDGIVINCPNRLYMGEKRGDSVDEIRHEDDPNTIFRMD